MLIFSLFIAGQIHTAELFERKEAFTYVIYVSATIISIIGVLVWFFMKSGVKEQEILLPKISKEEIAQVLKLPSVWLLMVIILCAYVGYKITDVFSLYAKEVMLYDEVQSAQVGTFLLFIRPVVGVLVGIIADRSKITFWLMASFFMAIIGSLLFALGIIAPNTWLLFFLSVMIVATGIYAARALYFAVMRQGRIPLALTGTAVGLISIIGYTPDIFAGPAYGYLLDANPGEVGHQHVFVMLAVFSFVGGVSAMVYHRMYKN